MQIDAVYGMHKSLRNVFLLLQIVVFDYENVENLILPENGVH